MASEVRTHVVQPPPGHAVLGWAVLGVSALPMVLLPLADPTLLTPGFLAVALGAFLLLLWLTRAAFVRARLTVAVDPAAGEVRIAGPLYARAIPLEDIDTLHVGETDGLGHGLVNWPVTGRAASRRGLLLTLGGTSALAVETHGSARRPRERFTVVAEDAAAATAMWEDIERAMGGGRQPPRISAGVRVPRG